MFSVRIVPYVATVFTKGQVSLQNEGGVGVRSTIRGLAEVICIPVRSAGRTLGMAFEGAFVEVLTSGGIFDATSLFPVIDSISLSPCGVSYVFSGGTVLVQITTGAVMPPKGAFGTGTGHVTVVPCGASSFA